MKDPAFFLDRNMLDRNLDQIMSWSNSKNAAEIPATLPYTGIGESAVLDRMAPIVLGGAQNLGAATAFAHMDPPTPWITWITTFWNASSNQNLLHRDTAPTAREMEQHVVAWLAPFFGMNGGHMVPGSTIGNLTGIWAARDVAGAEEVVASSAAHLSVRKAAKLLGMRYREIDTDAAGRMRPGILGDVQKSCLVLTAGTTSSGAIDPFVAIGQAAWTHIDAAWAGALRLSERHAAILSGIEGADSVALSAHKWLFQPKESALIFFRETERAHAALSFGGAYLAAPNIGVLGSHGAIANPLLAMLWAWGRTGIAQRIDQAMENASKLARYIRTQPDLQLWGEPQTGVVVWRSKKMPADELYAKLPQGSVSVTTLEQERWMRNVAVNPNLDLDAFLRAISDVHGSLE